MKNRIYTSLLFGISLAFSVAGYTQAKPSSKLTSTKTILAATPHSKHSKTIAIIAKTSVNNKKKPLISIAKNKKDSVAKSKPASRNKSVVSSKASTNKQTADSEQPKNHKLAVAQPKSNRKTQVVALVPFTRKHSVISSKFGRKTQSFSALEPIGRKHTVISAKTITSVAIEPIKHTMPQKRILSPLNLGNMWTDQAGGGTNDGKKIRPVLTNYPQSTKVNTAHVSIETSLFLDGLEAGLSKDLILQLTDIFAWDIDFATNLRPDDQFTVVYGKKMVDGKEIDGDDIIAAEFINQGISYQAVRYVNESGIVSYYTPDGESMQRAFLTTPVDFIKISSPFDMHRKHPILNRIRAHKGIDYAARIGTPVKTTGDGVVTFIGRKGAYGQVVTVQHNDHYDTLYAHMSDFKEGLAAGAHVRQGDIIGYVGQTGLATGPHLHYEFHVDGLYRDPETVKIPHSTPISDNLLADFKAQTHPFFVRLNQAKAKSLFAKTHSASVPGIPLPPASMQSSRYD